MDGGWGQAAVGLQKLCNGHGILENFTIIHSSFIFTFLSLSQFETLYYMIFITDNLECGRVEIQATRCYVAWRSPHG